MNGWTFTDGKIGKAFTFDGVNDYVSLPDNSLNFTSDFSVSTWINLASLSTRQCILGSYFYTGLNGGIKGFRFYYGAASTSNTGGIRIDIGDSNSNVVNLLTNNYLTTNTWYHVVVTRKSSTGTKIYINGSLSISDTSTTNPGYEITTYPTIGVAKWASNASGWYMSSGSKIDALNVWQKEITQAEVTELYNSGNGKQLTVDTKIVTNGLVLNLDASRTSSYPNSGTTWTDISGNSNNGTLVNGVGYTASNEGTMTFDGVNDYVSVTDSASLRFGTGGYTISLWVKPSSFGNPKVLIQKGSALGGWQIYYDTGGYLHFTQQFVIDIGTIQFSTNQWKNIVLTSNGGTDRNISMYVNGTSTGTYTCTANQNYNLTSTLTIGADGVGNNYYLNGNIQNVLMYNRKLNSTEVTQNFNATKSRFGL
jgi:hypothetical protein